MEQSKSWNVSFTFRGTQEELVDLLAEVTGQAGEIYLVQCFGIAIPVATAEAAEAELLDQATKDEAEAEAWLCDEQYTLFAGGVDQRDARRVKDHDDAERIAWDVWDTVDCAECLWMEAMATGRGDSPYAMTLRDAYHAALDEARNC